MNTLGVALDVAAPGFEVFRLRKNSKLPAFKGWQAEATCDRDQIARNWHDAFLDVPGGWNVGIYTGRYRDGALMVLDVDVRDGKPGMESLRKLVADGLTAPTYTQRTPSGGFHLFYRVPEPVRGGVNIWPGIDVKSHGGYVVAAGSTIDGKAYTVAEGMPWLH